MLGMRQAADDEQGLIVFLFPPGADCLQDIAGNLRERSVRIWCYATFKACDAELTVFSIAGFEDAVGCNQQ